MTQFTFLSVLMAALLCASRVSAQDDDSARQVAQERRLAAGFVRVRTIQGWPPGDKYPTVFLVLFDKK